MRVIEFCQIAAGPFAGLLLADMGADVIKVESPDGDGMRNGESQAARPSIPSVSMKRTIPMYRIGMAALFWCAMAAQACDYPDQGTMPLHRAVTKVKLLPETEARAAYLHNTGTIVQYALLLEQTLDQAGRCYWTVEAIAAGKVWRRFYVTPDGKRLLDEDRKPRAAPRGARPSAAARAGVS